MSPQYMSPTQGCPLILQAVSYSTLCNWASALWGSWAPKPFCVLHFLCLGNKPQPPWPSLSSKGQLLIREGRGCRDQGGAVKCSLGAGSWFLSRNIHSNVFERFCRTKIPNKWKKDHQLWKTMKVCIYADPNLWPYFLLPNYKTTSYSLPKEGTDFGAWVCCGLLCLAKQ